ncbi:hypothetical protein D3C87_1302150 [compost metagenome]
MVGVDQLLTLVVQTHQRQAHQRCLGRIKLQAFAVDQLRQRVGLIVLTAPVEAGQRQLQVTMHQLHRCFETLREVEAAAQDRLAVEHRLPRSPQTFGIEPAGLDAELVHVGTGRRLVEAVEQQTGLHRRQRVDVFDLRRGHRQPIQLRLAQARQREVRRGHAARAIAQAMVDQRQQFSAEIDGQGFNLAQLEAFAAEGPVEFQLTAIDLAVHRQPVRQWRIGGLRGTAGFLGGREQRVLGKALVELAEVVERHSRLRQRSQRRLGLGIAHVAQQAIAQAFAGDVAQLLLDRLDRSTEPGGRCQAHREQAGKPADGAGQVDVVEQFFAAMTFELNQRR